MCYQCSPVLDKTYVPTFPSPLKTSLPPRPSLDRFERSRGKVCRGNLTDLVTPETVREEWDAITSFKEGALYPTTNGEAAGLLAQVSGGVGVGLLEFGEK